MKPFNLEEAKAGKPVQIRDGLPVRIICFDRKSLDDACVLGLLRENDEEITKYWHKDGKHNLTGAWSPYDLFMVEDTIEINGHKVPKPTVEPPRNDDGYYYAPDVMADDLVATYRWDGGIYDYRCLKRGLIHLTKESAIAHSKALLSFTKHNND